MLKLWYMVVVLRENINNMTRSEYNEKGYH